ncbi:MAG: hydroxyacid dehydrogenase [Gammaproteobacteria bacterium]|nr:hydroxyacid dehydrogenase [Gammaproteobacteria bacterium]
MDTEQDAETGWIALAGTEDLPILSEPVELAARGVAPVKTVALPYRPLTSDEYRQYGAELRGASAILLRSGYVTAQLLDELPNLKVVAVHGAGVDPVDLEACAGRSVQVTNTPGANATAVTELTVGLMLALMRQIPRSAHLVQQDRAWDGARHTGGELRGRRLGLVGFGQIGQRVANIATAFGMEVMAHDPGLTDEVIVANGAVPVGLEHLCAEADIVSLHAPAIPATHHMLDGALFAKMKAGVRIVNCARGSLIDENALAAALRSGQVGGAALDVLDGEPPDPNSPLYDAPNIIITPHMAGSTFECLATIAKTAGTDIVRVLQGEKPLHPVV